MNSLVGRKGKIGVVSISLDKGGAERSTSILTKMLHDEGYEVHLVVLNDSIQYEFAGHLFNLGIEKKFPDTSWRRLRRIQKLRHFLESQKFDYIIDTRARRSALIELIYLYYVYANLKFIYIVHSGKIEKYVTNYDPIAQLIIKKCYKIIGVSNSITERINLKFSTNKASTIYNSVADFDKQFVKKADDPPYILFLGRIDDKVKNFSLLIAAYSQSQLLRKGIQLYIVGDGPDKEVVHQIIEAHKLQDHIKLCSFTPNVYALLKDALFLTLTSRHEGFPMVLIEALSVGTPVVSVDCTSGPSEIITHESNGLLVENHRADLLAKAFDRFLLDENLYKACKANSKQSVAHLNQKIIGKQWSKLLNP